MRNRFFMVISLITITFVGLIPAVGGMARNSVLTSLSGKGAAFAEEKGTSKVVFKVKCYDEGKAVLQGMKGIKKIETGFHYIYETDTVYFDPTKITIEEMENSLKKAGTYVETIR